MDNVPRKEPVNNNPIAEKPEKKKLAKSRRKKNFFALVNWKWVVTVFFSSLAISVILSILSSEIVDYLSVALSIIVLFFFISIGVVFDIVGLAVSTVDSAPFHSMAARKVKSGRIAVHLISRAEQVSSFCNDVIGDICGVVSGSTAAAIAIRISTQENSLIFLNLLICGIVSALTVGLKAVGKAAGFHFNRQIVTIVAAVISFFSIEKKQKKKQNRTKK